MINDKIKNATDCQPVSNENGVKKQKINEGIWVNALMASPLDRMHEEKIVTHARTLCEKYTSVQALSESFKREKKPRDHFENKILLMTYGLAVNYVRGVQREQEIEKCQKAREKQLEKYIKNRKGRE